jgi:Uma2 family endonuclease
MSTAPVRRFTVEEYLAMERTATYRSQYYRGEIFAMPGGTKRHGFIEANTIGTLIEQLKGYPCRVLPSDTKVMVSATGLITYPDAIVICDEDELIDDEDCVILNPVVVVEVLSPSTESFDRGEKSRHYRLIESLQEYVLIAQNRRHIERYARQPNGDWMLTEASEAGQSVRLDSIQCELRVEVVYDKLRFSDENRD